MEKKGVRVGGGGRGAGGGVRKDGEPEGRGMRVVGENKWRGHLEGVWG